MAIDTSPDRLRQPPPAGGPAVRQPDTDGGRPSGTGSPGSRAGHGSGGLSPVGPAGRRLAGRPAGEVAGLAALLAVTAAAYLWNLTASGYSNSFYAAAVQAGTRSWKAFFFGSIDASNYITVDKPPASLWVMELAGRVFGFGSASLLVPQVLEGVATVALVYAALRRGHGHRAGMAAGVVVATTPVAALMFRFDNPDALLVLLITAATYCTVRAIEGGRTRWLVLAGSAIGFAFLAKMGQALLVLPALGGAYLLAGPPALRRRLVQLLAGTVAIVAAAGWWVLTVTLWPASSRPLIDGSPTDSIWNLIVGYNGLSRVVSTGGAGGGGGSNFSGAPGALRLFNDLMGGQASWLLPAAAAVLVGGLVATRKAPRTDRDRAALVIWGGWLVVTGAVFSFGQGVIHTYYTVALVPAIAALIGLGVAALSRHWVQVRARIAASLLVVVTAGWAVVILDRSPSWQPWLRPSIAVAAALAAGAFVAGPRVGSVGLRRWVAGAGTVAAVFAGLGGPVAYTVDTLATAHTGSVPSAGPSVAGSFGGGPGGGAPGGGFGGASPVGGPPSGGPPSAGAPGVTPAGPGAGGAGAGGAGAGGAGAGGAGAGGPGAGGAGAGGPGVGSGAGRPGVGSVRVSAGLVRALDEGSAAFRWVAATDGSQSAATLELATDGRAVMAIGGFNDQGEQLSLARFEAYVAAGDIHYFVAGGAGGGPGGPASSGSQAISSWVESHFEARTIGTTTVYDLTTAKAG